MFGLIWLLGLMSVSSPVKTDITQAYRQAKHLADCARLHQQYRGELLAYECYWQRGKKEKRHHEAVRMLEAIVKNEPNNFAALLYLANLHIALRNKHALTLLKQAREGFSKSNHKEGEFWATMAVYRFYRIRQQVNQAAEALAQALRVATSSGNQTFIAEVKLEEGWHLFREAKYAKAWTLFKQLEADIPDNIRKDYHPSLLDGLGASAWSLGRFNQAFATYQKELNIIEPHGLLVWESEIRSNLALLSSWVTDPRRLTQDEIYSYHQAALDVAIRSGDRKCEAVARLRFGQMQPAQLVPAVKISHLRKTLKLFQELQDPQGIRNTLRLLAPALLLAGPTDRGRKAFKIINEAINSAQQQELPEEIAHGWLVRAQMRWMVGARDLARLDSRTALKAIEHIRQHQRDRQLQARVLGRFAFAYRRLAGFLIDPARGEVQDRDTQLAFLFMETMRSRVLLEAVEYPDRKECPQVAVLRDKISSVQKRLVEVQGTTEDRLGLLDQLEKLEVSINTAHEYHCGLQRSRTPTLVSLDELSKSLDPDQAILAYQVEMDADDINKSNPKLHNPFGGSWLLVVTREHTKPIRIPDHLELEPLIQMFLGLIKRRDGSDRIASIKLYDSLLAEALEWLPTQIRRLILIPDGLLHQVPFGALGHSNRRQPLAARYQISVVPSASLWHYWQLQPRPAPQAQLLALADPALSSSSSGATHLRAAELWGAGLQLGQLPHARTEALAAIKQLEQGSQMFVGAEATEHRLKIAPLTKYGLLHLATHAVVDDLRPHRSAVVLSPGADTEDGLLQPDEIATLDMRGLSVILSTCSSATGQILEGEGIMSLARYFFHAGAQAVVGSLWPLEDEETAKLISEFTAYLAQGKSLGQALQLTQRAWIEQKEPTSAWAGLVLQGNSDLIPFPRSKQAENTIDPVGLAVMSILLLLVVTIGAYWRLRRKSSLPNSPR